MLTPGQERQVLDAIAELCNRNGDRKDTHDGGLVARRAANGDIVVLLNSKVWGLEHE